MITIREKPYENQIKEWLHEQGIYQAGTTKQKKKKPQIGWFIKFWGGGMSQVGIPDILGQVKGKFFALEVKGAGGKPSTLQEINIEELQESGAYADIVWPEDFESIKTNIRRLINE